MARSITIDDVEYHWDELSDEVKNSLGIIEVSKNKINDLNDTLKFLKKARASYIEELKLANQNLDDNLTFGID